MSQHTATAAALRAPRHGPSGAPGRVTPLRVIPARIGTSRNGAFATLCVALLTLGLIGLLLLNTALAEGSLTIGALQKESGQLADRAGDLNESIARSSSSSALAAKAASLGMVRSNERAYIDLDKGTITGTAYPATRYQALPIVVAPVPAPRAVERMNSAIRDTTTALRRITEAAAKLALTATPKQLGSDTPPSATETLGPTPSPSAPPATTR